MKRFNITVLLLLTASPVLKAQSKPLVQPPKVVSVHTPDCPERSDCYHVKGTVVMRVGVNGDGTVADVKVVSGDPRLQEAAVQAAKDSHYEPARLNGVVTYAQLTLSLNFR